MSVSSDILSAESNPDSKSTVETAMFNIRRLASELLSTFSVGSVIIYNSGMRKEVEQVKVYTLLCWHRIC